MQKLAKALLTFREKIESIKKDADNPFFKSKYADLPSILEGIKSPLKESGLALTHWLKNTENGFICVSTLIETESGESVISEFPIFGQKPQEVWSSTTYARRYNTLALLDIPTDEDDDGNTANNAPRTKVIETPTGEKRQYARTEADDLLDEMGKEKDINNLKILFAKLYPLGKTDKQKAFYKSKYEQEKNRIENWVDLDWVQEPEWNPYFWK